MRKLSRYAWCVELVYHWIGQIHKEKYSNCFIASYMFYMDSNESVAKSRAFIKICRRPFSYILSENWPLLLQKFSRQAIGCKQNSLSKVCKSVIIQCLLVCGFDSKNTFIFSAKIGTRTDAAEFCFQNKISWAPSLQKCHWTIQFWQVSHHTLHH